MFTEHQLYKALTQGFEDDFEFYRKFTGSYRSLELFAGYGRISNKLIHSSCNLETVEISSEFANDIKLPKELNHVDDVLTFKSSSLFERIFAAYNSFCLFTRDTDIKAFFNNTSSLLSKDGLVCLNYYHPDYWNKAISFTFNLKGKEIVYKPGFDLEDRKNNQAIWIDNYQIDGEKYTFQTPVRIYQNTSELTLFSEQSGLELVEVVENFNKSTQEVQEPGWLDFIFKKQ